MTLPHIDLWYDFSSDRRDRDAGAGWTPDVLTNPQGPRHALTEDDLAMVIALRGEEGVAAQSAFETLYRTYAPAIARFAYGYLRDRARAEDVVADVFLAVWARRVQWDPRHGVRAYLYAAARHRALNILRGDARSGRRLEAVAAEGRVQSEGESADSSDNLAERQARLDAAMAALPEESRRLAELRWREGMSPAEIAGVLGIDRSAVDNRLSRLVKRLRALAGGDDPPPR